MPTNKTARGTEARVEKHRRDHKLVQTWVTPAEFDKLAALAKKQTRTMAAFVRHELYKLIGVAE
jgi:hypothetical protein